MPRRGYWSRSLRLKLAMKFFRLPIIYSSVNRWRFISFIFLLRRTLPHTESISRGTGQKCPSLKKAVHLILLKRASGLGGVLGWEMA